MGNRIFRSLHLNLFRFIIAFWLIPLVSISCGVDQENTSPNATITSPKNDIIFNDGDNITFNGTSSDKEDGTLPGSSLVWTSSIDGQIGTGTSFTTSSLSVGTHTITLTAIDSNSAIGTDSISITVNGFPTALFICPSIVYIGQQFEIDASSSFDVDGTIVSYVFEFGDGSPIVSQAIPNCFHTYNKCGNFILTLTVSDNYGCADTIAYNIECGLTMSSPGNISNTPGFYSQAANIHVDELGYINVIWQEMGSEVRFSQSQDQGQSFSPPQIIFPHTPPSMSSYFDITNINDYIHTVWTFYPSTGGAEILYSRSTNRGQSFETPLFLSIVDGLHSYVPSIASTGTDYIGAVWENTDTITIRDIVFTFSDDNGETFSYPIVISDFGSGPDIAIYDQYVYIVWCVDSGVEPYGIYISRSDDRGLTFSDPVNLCPNCLRPWPPEVKISYEGDVYIVWSDGYAQDPKMIMIAISENNGLSFDSFIAVPDTYGVKSKSNFILDENENIFLCYVDNLLNRYLIFSTDQGTSFSDPIILPYVVGNYGGPLLAELPNNQFVFVWSQETTEDPFPEIFWSIGDKPIQ